MKLIKNLALIMLVVLIFGSFLTEETKAEINKEEIVIGVIGAHSGPWQILGFAQKIGVELAKSDLAKKGGIGGIPVKIVYRDDEGDPTKSLNAVKELITQENMDLLIGTTNSTCAFAISPYLIQHKKLIFNGGCTGSGIANPEKYPYTFRVMLTNEIQAKYIANYIKENKEYSKIALVNDTGAVGMTAREELKKLLPSEKIVADITFNSGEVDLLNVAQKIKKSGAEVIICSSNGQDAAHVIKALEKVQYLPPKVDFVAFTGVLIKTFADIAGEAGKYVVGVNPQCATWSKLQPDGNPRMLEYAKRAYSLCKNQGEKDMLIMPTSANWYDCVMMAAKAIEDTNSVDGDILKKYLETDFRYASVSGHEYTFSPSNHEAIKYDMLTLSPAIGEIRHNFMLEDVVINSK